MNYFARTESEEVMARLVHDLRQPLGTLVYSTCYLQMMLGDAPGEVQQQLRVIQQQLDLASRLISDAAARLPRSQLQRAAAGESLDLRKSETSAVT